MQAVSNNSIISLNGLVLHFDGGRTKAVDGVALDVREGEFVAIVGPSGCGKSSLLNLIGTLDVPSSGEIRFRDQAYSAISDFSLFRRKNIGFVFQSALLIPTLNALDNVLVSTVGCAAPQGGFTARATQLLSKLGLQDRLDHYPAQMSGGERQRVSIARALINDPDVILADEPTGSLDSTNAAHVLDMLEDIRKEKALTIVMVTHDPAISIRADRIVHMRDGKIEYTEGAAA